MLPFACCAKRASVRTRAITVFRSIVVLPIGALSGINLRRASESPELAVSDVDRIIACVQIDTHNNKK